jgi:hypothetical protein
MPIVESTVRIPPARTIPIERDIERHSASKNDPPLERKHLETLRFKVLAVGQIPDSAGR